MPSWEKTHGVEAAPKTDWAIAAIGEQPYPNFSSYHWNDWNSLSGYQKLYTIFNDTNSSELQKNAAEELRERFHSGTEFFDAEK